MKEKHIVVAKFYNSIDNLINIVDNNGLIEGELTASSSVYYTDSSGNQKTLNDYLDANISYNKDTGIITVYVSVDGIRILSVSFTVDEYNSIKTVLGLV